MTILRTTQVDDALKVEKKNQSGGFHLHFLSTSYHSVNYQSILGLQLTSLILGPAAPLSPTLTFASPKLTKRLIGQIQK